MDENQTPHLYKSGLKLVFKDLLTASDFQGQVRLVEDKVFTNGMMNELCKTLNTIGNNKFFELLKSIVPLSIVNDARFPEDQKHFFGSRYKLFEAACKKERKKSSTFPAFLEKEFIFLLKENQQKKGTKGPHS